MTDQPFRTPTEAEVLHASADIVAAFEATDTERYFAAFAPETSFIFHPEPARLDTRADYEALWASWIEGGWRVVSCASSKPLVTTYPGGAVFSHVVDTTVFADGAEESYTEQETIVFRVEGDGLIAVHEHLSAYTGEASA
ncbi:YybH family protein [Leucobacter chinensis]|uniref:YybH family protein n=1 Tax=Leucobacter chinensis TaxID=2851010 RepID=UPI001C23A5B7|nr:nuclear transport factor 2 family protein [Leucobacter chinensis]